MISEEKKADLAELVERTMAVYLMFMEHAWMAGNRPERLGARPKVEILAAAAQLVAADETADQLVSFAGVLVAALEALEEKRGR